MGRALTGRYYADEEQLQRLRSENHNRSEAAGQAETLKTQLVAQLAEEVQKLDRAVR